MTTPDGTAAAAAITVPAHDLRAGLRAVLPHVSRDDQMAALTCVRLEAAGGSLFLAATDRRTMAVARLGITAADQAAAQVRGALLPLESARALSRLLKGAAGSAALVMADAGLTADIPGTAGGWATLDSGFPQWRKTLGGLLAREPGELRDSHQLDPVLLKRFAACGSRRHGPGADPLRMRVTAARGTAAPVVLFARGDWFLGALMAVRGTVADSGYWAGWAEATATAAGARGCAA
jgi:DNA polymerase III beta subunit, central domain